MIPLWQSIVGGLLGWPVTILVLGLVFRNPLARLLDSIDFLKFKGVGVDGELSATGKASEQLDARDLTQPDPLALRPGPQQLQLPLPEEIAKRQELVRRYGGENELLIAHIQTVKDDLAALQFPLDAPDTTEILIRHLAATQLLQRAEFLYRLIFGSQLAALHKLNVIGPLKEAEIRPLYERAHSRSQRFYADSTFEQWIGFLIQQGVVVIKNDSYAITRYGREFLGFVTSQGLPRKAH